jgi:NAD(P)-dependent dehydrogenase (short-subunit alcohol dehydrogenase family)
MERLTDEQWARVAPHIPKHKAGKKGGRPRADDRGCFEGILWILRTGARWKDLPKAYPKASLPGRPLSLRAVTKIDLAFARPASSCVAGSSSWKGMPSGTKIGEIMMLLKNKVAVIYGAGGAIGSAVARAFAREGAKLFLTGRHRARVEVVAKEIVSAGGSAEASEVDALDEQAVGKHLQSVIDKAGYVDISFNAVGIPFAKILGVPLVEIDVEQFSLPIASYTRSYFLTARLAARRMVQNKSGVIMTVTALPSRMGTRLNGGYGSAQAAMEALTRDLSAELAPQGIRVVGLRPHGIPETSTMKENFDIKAKVTGMTWEQFQSYLAGMTHSRRVMRLEEVANMAVFMASDKASGMTGTTVNLTMGSLDD